MKTNYLLLDRVRFGHYATNRKIAGSIPDEVIGFEHWPNPSNSAVSLTEMSSRKLPMGRGRSSRKVHLTVICGPTVQKMWEPRRLTALWASGVCYGASLPIPTSIRLIVRKFLTRLF
jgi:hypothetical protein